MLQLSPKKLVVNDQFLVDAGYPHNSLPHLQFEQDQKLVLGNFLKYHSQINERNIGVLQSMLGRSKEQIYAMHEELVLQAKAWKVKEECGPEQRPNLVSKPSPSLNSMENLKEVSQMLDRVSQRLKSIIRQ